MRNKLSYLGFGVVFTLGFTCAVVSCKKEAPWASSLFAGNFSGTETCLLTGVQPNSLNIVATSATQVSITNLYGQSKPLIGNVSHDTCTIPPQICDTFVIQGTLLLSSDSLSTFVIASSFGKEDKCNAVLIKH